MVKKYQKLKPFPNQNTNINMFKNTLKFLILIGLIAIGVLLTMIFAQAEEKPKPNMQPIDQQLGSSLCEDRKEGAEKPCEKSQIQSN